jgi:hypothetical protein
MTEHEHMPPADKHTASWLSPGKIKVVMGDKEFVLPWHAAWRLANSLAEALQLEKR